MRWPSGLVETFHDLPVDRRFEIEEASGCTPASPSDPPEPSCAVVSQLLEDRAASQAANSSATTEVVCEVQGRPAALPKPGLSAEGPKPRKDPPGKP